METHHSEEKANNMARIKCIFQGAHTNEIDFEDLSANDELLIRTENSRYRFSVINPAQKCGTLSGGSLGDQLCNVVLLGGMVKSDGSSAIIQALRTESRAFFSICTQGGLKQLLTSLIVELTHIKAGTKEMEPV
ncbi:MAG TPA: hypothetical protein VE262_15895 [Blastocatellia bacterium]|nr:hypothetical protein [Blastocatellia bacterium]